jgi:predicted phage-related endonuclease
MEPWIADEFARQTGLELIDDKYVYGHPEHPFMLANLDRRIGTDAIVEIKTSRNEWTDVPDFYYSQVQHYLAVTGITQAYIAVMFGGGFSISTYEIPRDQTFIDSLIEEETAFWDLVQRRIEPEIDGSKSTYDELRRKWVPEEGKIVTLAESHRILLSERREAKRVVEAAEEELRRIDGEIMAVIGDAEEAHYNGKKVISWKMEKRGVLDSKALREAHPDIATEFTKPTTFRRLRVLQWPKD